MSRYDNDLIDLRDLAQEWRDLLTEQEEARDAGDTATAEAIDDDLAKYVALCDEFSWQNIKTPDDLENYGNGYEPTLIAESYFTDYAQSLAEDIGAISRDLDWPACHIDWDAAAEALQVDYTEITYDGDTYLHRSC